MAEAVFRVKATHAGIGDRVDIDSAAGVTGFEGRRTDPRAVAVAARHGYAIEPRKARLVSDSDFERFPMMFAMDDGSLRVLEALRPETYEGRVDLLLALAPSIGNRQVPDPYYGSLATFERALELIETACDALVREIVSNAD